MYELKILISLLVRLLTHSIHYYLEKLVFICQVVYGILYLPLWVIGQKLCPLCILHPQAYYQNPRKDGNNFLCSVDP